jgi:hypothetical protein
MTVAVLPFPDRKEAEPVIEEEIPPAAERPPGFFRRNWLNLTVLSVLLLIVGFIHGWNMYNWPGRLNDDEGTYVAQAWAVLYEGSLAHYTFTYDHPPLGWLLIAGYAWITDGFDRTATTLMVGREVMLIATLVSSALLYGLMRRLKFNWVFAATAVLLFALSPVAIHYQRMVFLDNLAVMWLLAALLLAASPRRSLMASAGSALCFAAAVLSKETAFLGIIPLVWLVIQNTDKRLRVWNLAMLILSALVSSMYAVFAAIKSEFWVGDDHVSLIGSLYWQLIGRPGSGSIFDETSPVSGLVKSWIESDPWILLAGAVLVPVGFCIKRLRPFALGQLVLLAMMLTDGYKPYPFVIALIPFAAILVGGVAQTWWFAWRDRRTLQRPVYRGYKFLGPKVGAAGTSVHGWIARGFRLIAPVAVVVCLAAFFIMGAPNWGTTIERSTTENLSGPYMQATAWVVENVDEQAVVIVDDYVWTDLALEGFENQIWLYKADLDPTVQAELLPDGYASVDYVVLGRFATTSVEGLPTVAQAIDHSEVVASFGDGEITVRKVEKPQ